MSIDTIGVEETRHPLTELEAWVCQKDDAEISVVELYDEGPARLGMSEVELREWVNEGLALQMFAIGGLTSVVRVVSRQVAPSLPSRPRQQNGY